MYERIVRTWSIRVAYGLNLSYTFILRRTHVIWRDGSEGPHCAPDKIQAVLRLDFLQSCIGNVFLADTHWVLFLASATPNTFNLRTLHRPRPSKSVREVPIALILFNISFFVFSLSFGSQFIVMYCLLTAYCRWWDFGADSYIVSRSNLTLQSAYLIDIGIQNTNKHIRLTRARPSQMVCVAVPIHNVTD